jgi:hypothetical protein
MGNLRDKFSDEEWEELLKQIEKEEQERVRNKVNNQST